MENDLRAPNLRRRSCILAAVRFSDAREARVKVPADVAGWTALGLSGDLRPACAHRREWRGPGFACKT